jgi:hypothetical protein
MHTSRAPGGRVVDDTTGVRNRMAKQPPVYIQRESPQSYWYYCPSARAYYPNAATCPEEWLKVVPRESP